MKHTMSWTQEAEALAQWVREQGLGAYVTMDGNVQVFLRNREVTRQEVRYACHFNEELPMKQHSYGVLIEVAREGQSG